MTFELHDDTKNNTFEYFKFLTDVNNWDIIPLRNDLNDYIIILESLTVYFVDDIYENEDYKTFKINNENYLKQGKNYKYNDCYLNVYDVNKLLIMLDTLQNQHLNFEIRSFFKYVLQMGTFIINYNNIKKDITKQNFMKFNYYRIKNTSNDYEKFFINQLDLYYKAETTTWKYIKRLCSALYSEDLLNYLKYFVDVQQLMKKYNKYPFYDFNLKHNPFFIN